MFKVFHVHSWYGVKDNLSFAQIKIYDLDNTDPTSEASLIQAAVTGEDGQSRYTREIYPSDALEYRKFWDNHLVPIPLQIFNLDNKTVYHGGIIAPELTGPIGAPKLNATVRVWWQTVMVNQTIYYGWEYNGTGTWTLLDPLGKRRPEFVGPLSMAMNHTITVSTAGNDFETRPIYFTPSYVSFTPKSFNAIYDFNNNTTPDSIQISPSGFGVVGISIRVEELKSPEPLCWVDLTIDGYVDVGVDLDASSYAADDTTDGVDRVPVRGTLTQRCEATFDGDTNTGTLYLSRVFNASGWVDGWLKYRDLDGTAYPTDNDQLAVALYMSWQGRFDRDLTFVFNPSSGEVTITGTPPTSLSGKLDIESGSGVGFDSANADWAFEYIQFIVDGDFAPVTGATGISGWNSPVSTGAQRSGIWLGREVKDNFTNVANFINATVFYARFCVQDADLRIQHPEVGDKLVNMPVSINLKTEGNTPYYLTKNLPTTDNGGCTDDPHKYRGGLTQFDKFSRFTNGTVWYALYIDLDENDIPDYFDKRDIRSFWINFGKHVRFNASLAYLPGDADNYNDIPEGPNLKDVKTPSRIGDEDVKKSDYYDGNWSMLVADVKYANTLTLRDDKPYKGFDVVFKWAGGARNSYPGQEKVVDVLRIENPYSIALLYNFWSGEAFGRWVFPYTPLANNKLLVEVHESAQLRLGIDTNGDYGADYWAELDYFNGTLEITGDLELRITNFDRTTGRFDVEIDGYKGTHNTLTVNIVENKTDPMVDYWDVVKIYITDCLATIKKHDVLPLTMSFIDNQGQVDIEADGRDEYTSVGTFSIDGLGPVEVEIWPVPATGTIRMLISAYMETVHIDGARINDFTGAILVKGPPGEIEIETASPATASAEEWNYIDVGDSTPPTDNLVFDGEPADFTSTESNVWLDGGGIPYINPVAYAVISGIDLDESVDVYTVFDMGTTVSMKLYRALLRDGFPDKFGLKGTLSFTISDGGSDTWLYLHSMVIPLNDDPMDDEADKWIFGGYDDFALVGTGHVYVTAFVHDIVYKVTDNLGDPLPAGQTEVDLILPNGEVVKRTPAPPELADVMTESLQWSYKYYGEGNAVFFQLPGATGPYGARILYAGAEVYYERDTIDALEVTEFVTIVAKVYKVKVIFEDCQGQLMPGLYYKFTLPSGRTDWDRTSREGEVDFPYMSAGTLTIHGVWWKGVELPLMEAKFATGEKINLVDGKLVLEIGEGIDAPIVVKVPIKDLIFYTMDFQGEIKIPRLNVTLTWMGTPKPWSTEKIYYLETLDPTGDANKELYNTSIQVHPLWFNYTVRAFFQKIADDSPMDGMTEWEAKYVFYKMPPTIYNITVTTVTDVKTYGEEPVDGKGGVTPGTSKWPGRTDVETPYEIKIDWKGWSEEYEDTIPTISTGPKDIVNERVVLRIFGSMNSVPVTTDNFPAWLVEAWNPELIGIRTALVCKEEIKLKTWAHDFWKSIIDGDYRVGDASFKIENDNGFDMIYYDLKGEKWVGNTYTSKWTEDIKDISAIMKDSHYTSNIYWNGSYLLKDLYFETNMTYSYSKGKNASFIVDKFYNASMTSDATPGADGFWSPNKVDPTLNFTLVGTENLWKTSRRFPLWKARITGNTWKDWYSAWFLVYELPRDTDEYKVAKGPDGKGLLYIPLPVAFIKLGAFAKGGEPLNKALIELWTLHMDVKNKVKTSEKDEGTGTIYYYIADEIPTLLPVEVSWKWEKKLVETNEPQVYDLERWDRLWLTFKTYTVKEYVCKIYPAISAYGVNLTNALRDTRLAVVKCEEGQIEVWLHFVGHDGEKVTYTVEIRWNGDLMAANTTTIKKDVGGYIRVGDVIVKLREISLSGQTGVWAKADVEVSGAYVIRAPTTEVLETKTIFVQVPPSPAKLILRNVLPKTGLDVAVSADYVYPLITDRPRDNNPVVTDLWGEEDGILSYGRWYTDADGYVDSFKDLGAADPRYGSVILPIAGWLNETFHDGIASTKDEFHYQLNIVWKSAVVYSDNVVLDKKGYITGPSEVYTVTFYLALSNSTKAPVKGLNAWIYYMNVTEWHLADLWYADDVVAPGVYPEDIYPPQDYEACEDSVIPCELRVTLASEAWPDGKKTFELIPGPRFMNTTWKYVFSANHSAIDWMDDLVATQFVLNNETFGDDGLRVKTTTRIDVPIMLNAARWVTFVVATWRDEAGVPTAYPMKDYIVKYEIRKPKYEAGPALTAISGTATTDAEGKVVLTSDPSDPKKVFWAGMVIRYRVEPPAYTSDYSDAFWSSWLKAKAVDFVDKKADYRAPAIAPIMSHAYYPDEEPTHYAIAKIETTWVPREEGGWWCSGLCVHEYRSKPFIVWVDYTAVTVRVTDFNGRPLAGAFVQLWDKASGKLAA
jgi:hypothetical protein